MKTLEDTLGIQLPADYAPFVKTHRQAEEAFEFFFRVDLWHFLTTADAIALTQKLRENDFIDTTAFAFAQAEGKYFLFYQQEKSAAGLSPMIYLVDEEGDVMYYAFNLSEFTHFEKMKALTEAIDTKNFTQQDLSPIENCTGSLYQYAMELKTSSFSDDYSPARNKKALTLFRATAEKGHPLGAVELASHYYFDEEETQVDQVIAWREKAIALGDEESKYELADFLLDHRPEEIDRAIQLLEDFTQARTWRTKSAKLKLARIYMKGTGGKQNFEKGLFYTRACIELQDYNAMADLAFYYYKGIGLEKDVARAHQLLTQANELVIKSTGSGMWDEFIAKLAAELEP